MAKLRLERHGAGCRHTKRISKTLQHHSKPSLRFISSSSDEKAARVEIFYWLAELEEAFQRIRNTGTRLREGLAPELIRALADAHRSDCPRIHEEVAAQDFLGFPHLH